VGEHYTEVWAPGNGRVPFPSIINNNEVGERFEP